MVTTPQSQMDWRRFVAILCFIFFYEQFVKAGLGLLGQDRPFYLSCVRPYQFWIVLTQLIAAVSMYLCGRSLWYNGRFEQWWLTIALAAVLGSRIIAAYFQEMHWALFLYGYHNGIAFPIQRALPWLALLSIALWNTRTPALKDRRGRPAWVRAAAAWSLCNSFPFIAYVSVYHFFHESYPMQREDHLWEVMEGWLPLLAAMFLLKGIRMARLPAIAMMLLGVTLCVDAYMLTSFVQSSLITLFASVSYSIPQDFSAFPLGCSLLNEYLFHMVFVESVLRAGPWLVIAWYVSRLPLRATPEDGSPYPRQYCGSCLYNLHGISATNCPECGCELGRHKETDLICGTGADHISSSPSYRFHTIHPYGFNLRSLGGRYSLPTGSVPASAYRTNHLNN